MEWLLAYVVFIGKVTLDDGQTVDILIDIDLVASDEELSRDEEAYRQ